MNTDSFNKETENVRNYQSEVIELKSTISELKNTIDRFNFRLDEAEEKTVIWKIGQWNSPEQSSKKKKKIRKK